MASPEAHGVGEWSDVKPEGWCGWVGWDMRPLPAVDITMAAYKARVGLN
jgi:hypothetical protein